MQNKKLIQFLIPLAAALILIAFIFLFPNFSRICELKAYDLKMRLTATLRPKDRSIADRIKIINVTDSTIKEMGWPSKSDHARMINILTQHKARMIAYDWIFHEPDNGLAQAVQDSGRVLWPVLFDLSLDEEYTRDKYPHDVVSLLEDFSIGKTQSHPTLWRTTSATLSHPSILQYAKGIGHISARNEEGNPLNDGVYRKVALVVDFAGHAFPSLALRAACNYLRVPLKKVKITKNSIILPQAIIPDTGRVKDIRIPINQHGEMWIYFPGLWQDNYFEPFWFENVLVQHQDQKRWLEYNRKFNENICFVGNASGKSKDTHVIPVEDNFPGVGIHATALFTILSGNFIRFSKPATDVLIILALALLVGVIANYKPPVTTSIIHLLLLVGYVALTFWIFGVQHLNLPTVFPALTILMGGVATLGYHFIWEQQEKENLLKEYNMIQLSIQQKEQHIQRLTLAQEETKQLTEEQRQELVKVNKEKERLIKQKKLLEERLAKVRDITLQPLREQAPLEEEWEQLREECQAMGIVTKDKRMLEIFRRVKKAARSNSPVLILGEWGTGKELVARAIHRLSDRQSRELVIVPTIQENLVESELFGYRKGAFTGANEDRQGFFARANGSTIFLDEVGEIPLGIQVKLLRVLNNGEYSRVGDTSVYKTDARVVAATNRNLKKEMQAGNFRKDLYFRLNVIPIELPPLRERKEDIEPLADYFIKIYSQKQKRQIQGLSQKAVEVLMGYDWPGNIRELENVIERAVALTDGELITEADLELTPASIVGSSMTGSMELDVSGDSTFLALLERNNFEIGKTAQALNQNRLTVASRFKGLCLKALAENDWDVAQAAKAITQDVANLELVRAKIKEYHDNTLAELQNYTSLEQLQQQVGKKFKNVPKKFHGYILELYEVKKKG